MRWFIAVVFSCIIYSCTNTDTERYKKIVDHTDKILVLDRSQGDSIWVSDSLRVSRIKDILKRNIKAMPSVKFVSDHTIELYEMNRNIGTLSMSNDKVPKVNFHAGNFTMTFHMTYGIEMFISNLPD